jgi:PAS domain S-box-containing protein
MENKNNQYFEKIFRMSPDAFMITRMSDGVYHAINEGYTKMFGYTEEEVLQQSAIVLGICADPTERDKLVKKLLLEKVIQNYEIKLRRKNGDIFPASISMNILDIDGTPYILGTARDLSDCKHAEEALKDSQILLKSSLESQKDTIMLSIDKEYRYLYFNKAHHDVMKYAYNQDIAVGMNILSCISNPGDRVVAKENYDRALKGESHSNIRVYGESNLAYYESFFNPIFNENNEIIGATGLARDITQRKNTESLLQMSEKKFHDLFSSMIEGFAYHKIITNEYNEPIDYEFLEINDSFEKYTGLTREKAIGRKVSEALPGTLEDPTNWVQIYGKVALTRRNICFESYSTVVKKWFSISAYSPQPGFFATLFQDITKRKAAEEALQKSEEKYRLITERINDVVWTMDLTGKSTFVSPSIEKFTGYSVDEYLNQTFSDRFTPESALYAKETFKKEVYRFTHLEKQPKDYQKMMNLDYRCKDGSIKTGEVLITPSFDENNICVALYGVTRDITDRKQAQIELRKLNEELETRVKQRTLELENSNKALESFSYSVSHDLRAPLRAINGFSELLVRGYEEKLGSEGSHLLQVIIENSSRMDQLIKGMLALSRVTSSELIKTIIDMNQLVKSVIELCFDETEQNNIELQVEKLADGYGDAVLLRQVWTNLFENAVKFSKNKEKPVIQISSSLTDQHIVYSIKDNGAGFNPNYQNKLFQVFHRLHGPEEFEGTGIGLAIVERIIYRHGGKVWAEGEEGVGAIFYFSLPIQS